MADRQVDATPLAEMSFRIFRKMGRDFAGAGLGQTRR